MWFFDSHHPLVRALVNTNRIIVNEHNKYLFRVDQFLAGRGLMQREVMLEVLANKISTVFGTEDGYYSVLDSQNPNEVPYYNSQNYDERFKISSKTLYSYMRFANVFGYKFN